MFEKLREYGFATESQTLLTCKNQTVADIDVAVAPFDRVQIVLSESVIKSRRQKMRSPPIFRCSPGNL